MERKTRRVVDGLILAASKVMSQWGEACLETDLPRKLLPSRAKCEMLILTTKIEGLCPELISDRPASCAIFSSSGLLDKMSLEIIANLVRHYRCSLGFIGDLDVLDLLIFYRNKALLQEVRVPLKYIGISDAWLDHCLRATMATEDQDSLLPIIRMTRSEASFARLLHKELPGLEKILGPQSVRILLNGRKLELEGATNPALYKPRFISGLRRIIFQKYP